MSASRTRPNVSAVITTPDDVLAPAILNPNESVAVPTAKMTSSAVPTNSAASLRPSTLGLQYSFRAILAPTGYRYNHRSRRSCVLAQERGERAVDRVRMAQVRRVTGTRDADELFAVRQLGEELLGPLHRDRGVGLAVEHDRGRGDLRQAIGDVISPGQRPVRLADERP